MLSSGLFLSILLWLHEWSALSQACQLTQASHPGACAPGGPPLLVTMVHPALPKLFLVPTCVPRSLLTAPDLSFHQAAVPGRAGKGLPTPE